MILVLGGYDRKSTVETFDSQTQHWHGSGDGCTPQKVQMLHFPNQPDGCHECAMVYFNGCVYVLGGWRRNGVSNEVSILNIALRSWTKGPCMQSKRWYFGATELNGKIYCAGGGDGSKPIKFISLHFV